MNIRFKKGINKENALILCGWSNKEGKEFQEQWMGQKISFPLNYEKIKELEKYINEYRRKLFGEKNSREIFEMEYSKYEN